MTINSISIKDFKSIEALKLDFKDTQGLWEITGPVGSGKTSIGEALLYGLFGNIKGKSNSDLIKWGKKRLTIDLDITSKGKSIFIERSVAKSSSTLEVSIDGKPVQMPNKNELQKYLETEVYDVSRLTLELLCVISFNGFKSMCNLSVPDTKKFLDQTFGLQEIASWTESCLNEKKEANEDVRGNQSDQRVALAKMEKIKEWKPIDTEALQKELDETISKYKEAQAKLDALKKERDSKIEAFSSQILSTNKKLNEVTFQGKEEKKAIEFLNKGVCPTCGAPLDKSHLKEHEERRDELLKEYKELTEKQKEIEHQKNQVRLDYSEIINKLDMEVATSISHGSQLRTEISKSTQLDDESDVLEVELKSLKQKELELQKELDEWSDLHKWLQDNARQAVLDTRIPTINKYISDFLIALGQPYSVHIDSSFKCQIFNTASGNEFNVASLSTGQTKMLDMVIILSVLETLLSKVNFNIFFCDELLSNMDADLRDQMCKLLKENLLEGQSMFLICHAPLSKEHIDGTIRVGMKNQTSIYSIED